jgi:phytol kinase
MAIVLLMSGLLIYLMAENTRLAGQRVPFITALTEIASRKRDEGHLVMGPVTLALGAMFSLFLFPLPVATMAILALAFADGFSSVMGKIFGRVIIPFTGGKTLIGSLTAFTAIFIIVYLSGAPIPVVLAVAASGMVLEALPLEDLDNVVLPVGLGFVLLALL